MLFMDLAAILMPLLPGISLQLLTVLYVLPIASPPQQAKPKQTGQQGTTRITMDGRGGVHSCNSVHTASPRPRRLDARL